MFIGQGRHPAIVKNLFGNLESFIAGIVGNDLDHRVMSGNESVEPIESLAVMDI